MTTYRSVQRLTTIIFPRFQSNTNLFCNFGLENDSNTYFSYTFGCISDKTTEQISNRNDFTTYVRKYVLFFASQ